MENITEEGYFKSIDHICSCEQCGRCSSACPITGVDGFNIRQIIRCFEISQFDTLFQGILPWLCLTCGRCEEACPNGVNIVDLVRLTRKNSPKKLIPPVPCVGACPVGINIPGFIRMAAEGELSKAIKSILQKTPMPGVLGRVCSRPCESKCRRGSLDKAVSICNIKRYISDNTDDSEIIYEIGIETKKKVLVIGSGPSSLSVSYYLRRKGHHVTMIEERDKPGGMLRYGIPEYRLPEDILDIEINRILNMGVDLRTKIKLEDFEKANFGKEHFDAVFIGIGLQASCMVPIDNNFSKGEVILGLDFLADIRSHNLPQVGDKVLIIGGGNVAIDVAISAIHLGAKDVILACLEDRENMPADLLEIKLALDKGVKIFNSWGLHRFLGESILQGVELVKCESVFDRHNEFNPKIGTERITLNVDQLILAIGQTSRKDSLKKLSLFIGNSMGFGDKYITVDVRNKLLESSNIFAGGDITGKAQSVVNAIVSGRNAAKFIDCLLGGDGLLWSNKEHSNLDIENYLNSVKKDSYIQRQEPKMLTKVDKTNPFAEINQGLTPLQVENETSRCLCCDLESELASS